MSAPVVCFDVPVAAFPCMLGSAYDNAMRLPPEARVAHKAEAPGTFICRGTLKCGRSQNVQRANVWVLEGEYRGDVYASVRSLHPDKSRSSSTLCVSLTPGPTGAHAFKFIVPFLPPLDVVTLLRFLGFSGREAIEAVLFAGEESIADVRLRAEMRRRFAANFSDASLSTPLADLYTAVGALTKKPEATPEKRRRQVHLQITTELLPHIGFDDTPLTRLKKAAFLGLLVRDMLHVHLSEAKAAQCKNTRDFEGNKSVELSAVILARMMRQLVTNFRDALRNKLYERCAKDKAVDVPFVITSMDSLSRDIKKAFANGEVTVQKNASSSGLGVILMVQQGNALTLQTDVERVSTALPREGKYVGGRALHCSSKQSYGPAQTPEGPAVGLLQNPAVCARVRVGVHARHVVALVLQLGAYAASSSASVFRSASSSTSSASQSQSQSQLQSDPLVRPFRALEDLTAWTGAVLVFVNGDPIGVTNDPVRFAEVARQARRDGVLPRDCSVVRDLAWGGSVLISCDIGTIVRALLHVPSLHRLPDAAAAAARNGTQLWDEMERAGIVDWVDAWEMNECRVADLATELAVVERAIAQQKHGVHPLDEYETVPYTHVTPHPQSFFATAEGTVAFASNNPAPRVCFQSAMAAQVISTPSESVHDDLDFNTAHTLDYPQRPIASTDLARAKGVDKWPMGQNAMTVIAISGGLNIDDAIIINRDSEVRCAMVAVRAHPHEPQQCMHIANCRSAASCASPTTSSSAPSRKTLAPRRLKRLKTPPIGARLLLLLLLLLLLQHRHPHPHPHRDRRRLRTRAGWTAWKACRAARATTRSGSTACPKSARASSTATSSLARR